MIQLITTDRRREIRHLVSGPVTLFSNAREINGELVTVSSGGLMALCVSSFELGSVLNARFSIEGFPEEVLIHGRVAHSVPGLLGIDFIESPPLLDEIALWLDAGMLAELLQ
jgi:hypothetical protein